MPTGIVSPVVPICVVLTEHHMPIAPSSYYAHRRRPVSAALLNEAYLVNQVIEVHRWNRGVYGIRKMWHALTQKGQQVGRDQVARLMRIAGLEGVRRGRHHTVTTTRRREGEVRAPDLIGRNWDAPERPDQWWVADFTYCWTAVGFCYVSFVVDVYSRRILGWRVSMSKTTDLVLSAVEQALFTRRRTDTRFTTTGLVHHSDAGSQGGFNRSSQHLDHGGAEWDVRTSGCRSGRRARIDDSGRRTGRCGRRCDHLAGRNRHVLSSGISGGRSRRG